MSKGEWAIQSIKIIIGMAAGSAVILLLYKILLQLQLLTRFLSAR
jgi:hypothetical protein